MSEPIPIQSKEIGRQDDINELQTHLVTVGDLLMNVQGADGCCDDTPSNAGWMVCNFARRIQELSKGGAK